MSDNKETCEGCKYNSEPSNEYPCVGCIRLGHYIADYFECEED